MKKAALYSLFFIFIRSIAGNAQPQPESRLIRTEDSSNAGLYGYANTVYIYSGGRGHYKTHPVLGTYLQFDSSVTGYFDISPSSTWDSTITVYAYDAHSKLTCDYYYTKFSGSWNTKIIADSGIYDVKSNLRRFYKGYIVNGIFQADRQFDFNYNSKGQMISRQYTLYNNPQGSTLITYSYDAFNNLVSETTMLNYGGWVNSGRTTYQYFANYLLQQTHELWNGATWVPERQSKYDYNTSKLLIKTSYYSGTSLQLQGTDSNIYNANGDLSLHFYIENATGFIIKDTNTYDASHNRLSSQRSYYDTSIGVYQNRHLITTTYNKYNQPLVKREYDWDTVTSTWQHALLIDYYERNHYEEYVTGVETAPKENTVSFTLYPSPADNFIHISLTLKGTQNCTFIIADLNGRLLRQWAATIGNMGDRTIPVDDLAPGNYVLQVNANGQRHAKRFVISR